MFVRWKKKEKFLGETHEKSEEKGEEGKKPGIEKDRGGRGDGLDRD